MEVATEQATERLGEAADSAKEKASGAAEQAKSRAQQEIDTRSTQAGEEVSSFAEALRTTADKLREEGKDGPAKAADRAAEQARKVGGYLTDADGDKILSDVENFARRKPWVVLAGGVVVGIAAARFLKASSAERSSGQGIGNGHPATRSAGALGGNGHEPSRSVGSGPSAPPASPAVPPAPAPAAPSPSGGLPGTVPPPAPPTGS